MILPLGRLRTAVGQTKSAHGATMLNMPDAQMISPSLTYYFHTEVYLSRRPSLGSAEPRLGRATKATVGPRHFRPHALHVAASIISARLPARAAIGRAGPAVASLRTPG